MTTSSLRPAAVLAALLFAAACGGSTSGGTGSTPGGGNGNTPVANTQAVVVNAGPANNYVNGIFTTVTVCAPNTTNCQTIDGVLVDTGSSGLRILGSVLNVSLPQVTASNGSPLVECMQFLDGFTWGPVQSATVQLAGEQALSVPVQTISQQSFPTIPTSCSSTGVPENDLRSLGANGVLGIGLFRQDCGFACTIPGASNPGLYYACTSSACQITTASLTQQVQNPVWLFASDNNGVLIALPSVPAAGIASITGTLAFGIGTQSNNALGAAKVLTLDAAGDFTTTFGNQAYPGSFIDSGSNGLFFLDAGTSGLPVCADTSDFYCPTGPKGLSAVNRGANGTAVTTAFTIDNADTLLNVVAFNVFGTLGGPNPGSFDWGLPFFFGKTVFTAIEGQSSSGGVGPYFAY